jgi:hypothetical protein
MGPGVDRVDNLNGPAQHRWTVVRPPFGGRNAGHTDGKTGTGMMRP